MKRYILNEQIRADQVRLIGFSGEQIGVIQLSEALSKAKDDGLDLLLVSPEAKPPVCKIINYGQFRYEQNKKDKQARKTNKSNIVKELKMGLKISENDFQVRVRRANDFLGKGYKVKLTVMFKGREVVHRSLGYNLINRFTETISEIGSKDSDISSGPRSLTIMYKANKA